WSSWTPCSVTCGQGWTNRKRSCDNPKPEVGGMFCRGRDVQKKKCYERMCLHGEMV
ncbi:hypothetical protein HELRODRAFT_91911, partial [Helobdella robusta]|uniref:ADAMTS cysteine-rich domain-containing protein n=1 Tax=Helobdella robusta TaxID=6412 RepID=T1G8A4_HELRO